MRAVPAALSERLASGVTTLAHVWRIARREGQLFGFTDHDRPLVFDALICEPANGARPGSIEKSLGLGVDTASFAGAFASDALTEADLAAGVWDGARVDLFLVDWSAPELRLHLFAGRIGEVERGASSFEAELRGVQAPLNVAVGRVFSRFCDADLGDARCGVDLEAGSLRGVGAVASVEGPAAFIASGLGGFQDHWFARGRIVWDEGGESEVVVHAASRIELSEAPRAPLQAGAVFTVYAGCDKKFETCRAKFANGVNFRGFPHMPGNDAVLSGPAEGAVMDGSSRFA